MLKTRFYLSMLSVMVIDAAITATYAVLSDHMEVMPRAALANLALLGGLNLIGSYLMFRPVAAWLDGRASLDWSRSAILRLPGRATAWMAVVALTYTFTVFSLEVFTPPNIAEVTPFELRAVMFVWLVFVYGTYMCFVVYFAVSDLTAALRAEVFRREGEVLAAGGGRLLHRLIIVFAVVTVMPVALVIADITWFLDIRRAQGLDIADVVALDLIGALFGAALSLVFVTRALVKPIDRLVAAAARVRHGDLETRVPATTDDELGLLAVSFNQMLGGLQEREVVRELFGKYVSADVAEAILRDGLRPDGSRLGGGRLKGSVGRATVMFTDIDGFSTLVSTMNPAAVMEMLNEYLTLIAEPIQRHHGVINQFIGDAVLATFNLPVAEQRHAENAVRCALEIQSLLEGRRFAGGIRLNTRIGINTGIVVAGTVGPPDRLAYTVLGREVNLAARLEALNKTYGSRILLSAATRKACGDAFAFALIGKASLKGLDEPVEVFTVTPGPASRS